MQLITLEIAYTVSKLNDNEDKKCNLVVKALLIFRGPEFNTLLRSEVTRGLSRFSASPL